MCRWIPILGRHGWVIIAQLYLPSVQYPYIYPAHLSWMVSAEFQICACIPLGPVISTEILILMYITHPPGPSRICWVSNTPPLGLSMSAETLVYTICSAHTYIPMYISYATWLARTLTSDSYIYMGPPTLPGPYCIRAHLSWPVLVGRISTSVGHLTREVLTKLCGSATKRNCSTTMAGTLWFCQTTSSATTTCLCKLLVVALAAAWSHHCHCSRHYPLRVQL
jgi:hypothetical protein